MKISVLETDRCTIARLQEDDYENIKKLYTNRKVRKFLGGIVSSESFDKNFNSMLTAVEDSFYWTVRLKADNELIGLISIDSYHDGLNIELSYQFMPNWWGHGYAEEVIKWLIVYAFNELKLEKLVAETQSANKASCKLLQKVGMRLEQKVFRFGAEQSVFSIQRQIYTCKKAVPNIEYPL